MQSRRWQATATSSRAFAPASTATIPGFHSSCSLGTVVFLDAGSSREFLGPGAASEPRLRHVGLR